MLPYLVAGLGALYSVGKASDNVRYWYAYYKNTGRRPKYPFRSGSMDWMTVTATVGHGFGRLKRL